MNIASSVFSTVATNEHLFGEIETRELLDDVNDLIQSVALDGKFLYVNRAWRETLEYDSDNIRNLSAFEIIHPASRRLYADIYRRLSHEEKISGIDLDLVTKNGATISVEVTLKRIFRKNQECAICGIFRNATRRKTVEKALRDSEDRFQAFMNNDPAAAFMRDEAGHYVFVNKTMREMFSISDYENKSLTAGDLVSGESAAKSDASFRKVLETGEPLETVDSIVMPDGIVRQWTVIRFPFIKSDGQKFVGGVAFDITKRIETEQRLRQSENHYRNLVENGRGFICTHDRLGNLLSANPAAARSLGYEVSEIVGRNLRDFMSADLHTAFSIGIEETWQKATGSGLMYLITKDGRQRVWQYQNVKLTETVEEPIILGYAQDVTDMHQTEKHLKSLSLTDDLTGLYNRRGFLMLAERQLKIAQATVKEKNLFLIYADLDGLKQINDRFGHDTGSAAIIKIAELLAGNFRGSDVIARLGGDEFVVLVISEQSDTQELVTNRLNSKIAACNAQKNYPFELSVSIGITAVDPQKPVSIEELLRTADEAMYVQKKSKKKSLPETVSRFDF